MNLLIEDPLPRNAPDFSIIPVANEFGDAFLSLLVDDFTFAIQYDVYPWPRGLDNPLGFEGRAHIFRLIDRPS